MGIMYSKCATNCTRCPSYNDNLLTDEDRRNCSQGWYTYHGFRLSPEKLIACDGCQPVAENGNGTRYINCIIRRCARHNQVRNCAYCSAYPCDTLTGRVAGYEWLENLKKRLDQIPDDDFNVYVEPYLGIPHLDAIRAKLDPVEIVDFKPISITPRLATFPPGLGSSEGSKAVYQLIQELSAPSTGITFAQAEKQKQTHLHVLKLLWSFARFGELDEDDQFLYLDHKIYLAQKIHSSYDRVQGYFETLDDIGLHGEVIPLNEDRWLTPGGGLRRQGVRESSPPWVMKIWADESVGGDQTLQALQAYAAALVDAYGKTAYRRFARADMQILDVLMKE